MNLSWTLPNKNPNVFEKTTAPPGIREYLLHPLSLEDMRRTVDAALQRRWAEAMSKMSWLMISICSEDGMMLGKPGKVQVRACNASRPETSTNL